jgi:hypothetical protein
VNHKRVERIWRREGLKVPQKQKKKGRLWLNDGSCVRLRPERPTTSGPMTSSRTAPHDGRVYRTLNIIDEYTREALMIRVDRKLNSTDVLDALTDLFILRGPPEYIRSDNGPEFIAQKVRNALGIVDLYRRTLEAQFVDPLTIQATFVSYPVIRGEVLGAETVASGYLRCINGSWMMAGTNYASADSGVTRALLAGLRTSAPTAPSEDTG